MIPRLQSDPGLPRLDPIWREFSPRLPQPISQKAVIRTIPKYSLSRPTSLLLVQATSDSSSYVTAPESRYIGLESGRFSKYSRSSSTPGSIISSQTPEMRQITSYNPTSISLESGALGHISQSSRKQRCWLTKVIMAPWDLLERALMHSCAPSDNCMKGVQVTYWIVLIVGGAISAITALAPHLNA
jgi:hypothetical protein